VKKTRITFELYLIRVRSCTANSITLTSPQPDLPMLNHTYPCSRVARLFCAGDYMEKMLSELKNLEALSEDGSFTNILSFALQSYDQEMAIF
jgi:hypothetical protein